MLSIHKLEELKERLSNCAGKMWLEGAQYLSEHGVDAKYREMDEREDIVLKALQQVQDAIAVITQIDEVQSA